MTVLAQRARQRNQRRTVVDRGNVSGGLGREVENVAAPKFVGTRRLYGKASSRFCRRGDAALGEKLIDRKLAKFRAYDAVPLLR